MNFRVKTGLPFNRFSTREVGRALSSLVALFFFQCGVLIFSAAAQENVERSQLDRSRNAQPNLESLVGEWEFTSVLIDGVERPPFNPKLHLHFLFRANQFDRLWWWRDDEAGFCDRWGRYSFDGKVVYEKVVWVNPDNESSCQMDPDMKLGREARIPIRFLNQRMVIDFDVNGKTVGYVWSRVGGDLPRVQLGQ